MGTRVPVWAQDIACQASEAEVRLSRQADRTGSESRLAYVCSAQNVAAMNPI